ncbi:TOM1-like protein 1 [Glycine max]|nr:TOM1-like protein 1 [Glycine max]
MIKLIDDPQTIVNNRNKALMMIQAWGESTIELRYLPVYAETYKSLKSRGIGFPSRDNESLAPVFTPLLQILYIQFDIHGQSFTSVTPPRSATTPQADVSLAHLMQHDDIHVQSFTSEQIKETFDVARNSIELLSVFFNAAGCALNVNDEIKKSGRRSSLQLLFHLNLNLNRVMSPYDMLDDLDEMIFGKKDRDDDAFDGGQHPKNPQSSSKDDLNSF